MKCGKKSHFLENENKILRCSVPCSIHVNAGSSKTKEGKALLKQKQNILYLCLNTLVCYKEGNGTQKRVGSPYLFHD